MKNPQLKTKTKSCAIALTFIVSLLAACTTVYGQTLYINAEKGKDHSAGTSSHPLKSLEEAVTKANQFNGNEAVTLILSPGLYTIKNKLMINTKAGKAAKASFTIKAEILPGDKNRLASSMPVILSVSANNDTNQFAHCEALFIGQNKVIIKGIKFVGNPNTAAVDDYYPIRRQDKTLNGLSVSQCYFIGEANSSPIQSAFWASGTGIHVDHCIFHNSKIAFVLSANVNDFSLTHSIIDGAYNTALWYGFAGSVPKFVLDHNVITNSYYVMVYPVENGQPAFTFKNSYLTGNANQFGNYPKAQDRFIAEPVKNIKEINVHKTGLIKYSEVANNGITKDDLNIMPSSPAKETGAGIN